MADAEITVTTQEPTTPEADFAFYIDFKKGEGSASRVFSATHKFIEACEKLDSDLVSSIDANIETVMVLEDIESASIKTFLRSILEATDDQALKDLNWKSILGKFLVRSKYIILKWIEESEEHNIQELSQNIQRLAAGTDVLHIPNYMPPKPRSLIEAVKDFEEVKTYLVDGDEASMILPNEESADFNLSTRLDIEYIESLAIRETQNQIAESMVMIVKKPDYLANSMWELRHGIRLIRARLEDEEWLKDFQNRRIDVRPGDALRCRVGIEIQYGYDNELIDERYYILKVYEVLENQYHMQVPLLSLGEGDDW